MPGDMPVFRTCLGTCMPGPGRPGGRNGAIHLRPERGHPSQRPEWGRNGAIHPKGRPVSPEMGSLGDMRSSAMCYQIVGADGPTRLTRALTIVGSSRIRSL